MFLIVQNDPDCPLGTIAGVIEEAGRSFRVAPAYRETPFPPLAGLAGVIVLGGEMGVYQTERYPYLDRVRAFMKETVAAGVPLLGICLGGQLLAQVLGGEVRSPSPHGEKGSHPVRLTGAGRLDPLFRGVPDPFSAFQLHNDSFAPPPSALLLADSAACPAQAFRFAENAYGVQFHPEVDRAIVARWSELSPGEAEILASFDHHRAASDGPSRRILANFVELASPPRQP